MRLHTIRKEIDVNQLTDKQLMRLANKLWYRYGEGDHFGWDLRTIPEWRKEAWFRVTNEIKRREL